MNSGVKALWKEEDWWAIWFGFAIIIGALLHWIPTVPKVGKWSDSPLDAFLIVKDGVVEGTNFIPLIILLAGLGLMMAVGMAFMKTAPAGKFLAGFVAVFVLGTIASWIAHQTDIQHWGLSYAMWGLLIGLLISNTIGTPKWLLAGARTELYIKIGLVLLGAEILFKKILALGPPGLMVAWIVTPIVVIFMYNFALKSLKMKNKSLAIIIAAATSVCGVSAAIATAAACRSWLTARSAFPYQVR